MKNHTTFAIQLLAVALFVPSVWFYVHAGPDLFADQIDLASLFDSRRFWLSFAAPFVWIVHALVIIVAILRPILELGRRSSENHEKPKA